AGARARAVFARLGLVDGQRAALELGAAQRRDGLVAPVTHLDEPEAARTAGVAVGDDLGAADRAVLAEQLDEVVGGGREGEVADVVVLAHGHPLRAQRPAVAENGRAAPEPRKTEANETAQGAGRSRSGRRA